MSLKWALAWLAGTALLTWVFDRSPVGAAIRWGVTLALGNLVYQSLRSRVVGAKVEAIAYLGALLVWLAMVCLTWNRFQLPAGYNSAEEIHYRSGN